MKIYLDDMRQAPVGWTLAKSPREFMKIIDECVASGTKITDIAFDHDLHEDHYSIWSGYGNPPSPHMNGYDVVMWLIENHPDIVKNLEGIIVHTMNAAGGNRIEAAFNSFFAYEGVDVVPAIHRIPGWSR